MRNYLPALACFSCFLSNAVLAQQNKVDVVGIGLGISPAQAKIAAAKYDPQMAASVRINYGRSEVTGEKMGVVLMQFCKTNGASPTCIEEIHVEFGKATQKALAVFRNVKDAKLKTDELIDSISEKYGSTKEALQQITNPRLNITEVGVAWSGIGSPAVAYDFSKCYPMYTVGVGRMIGSENCPKYIGKITIHRSSSVKEITSSFQILLVDTESVTESIKVNAAREKAEKEELHNSKLRGTSKSVL